MNRCTFIANSSVRSRGEEETIAAPCIDICTFVDKEEGGGFRNCSYLVLCYVDFYSERGTVMEKADPGVAKIII